MSLSYLIAFDMHKPLQKTKYEYRYILKSKKTVFSCNDSIIFSDDLYPQEKEIAKNLFPQRKVYSIRSSVPLDYKPSDAKNINEDYYLCEKEQLQWLKEFLQKHIAMTEDVLFIKINLGQPIDYSNILSNQVNLYDLRLPDDQFSFDWNIQQFVNNPLNENKTL